MKNIIKIITAKIKAFVCYLPEWKWFLAGTAGLILPPLFFFYCNHSQVLIRAVGMLLQLLGISTVIIDIRNKSLAFSIPSPFEVWKERLSRCPLWHKSFGNGSLTIPSATVRGTATSPVKLIYDINSDDLQEQVYALKERINKSERETDSRLKEINSEISRIKEETKKEREERKQLSRSINKSIEKNLTGSLDMAATGVVWLFTGVVYSSFPYELFKLFGG
ncbi:MAG: hypothetical protein KQH59_09905 [Desulfobulbaceae bacterium]|nr:hypothetical protein [Desulfobulbaceae bacterium]